MPITGPTLSGTYGTMGQTRMYGLPESPPATPVPMGPTSTGPDPRTVFSWLLNRRQFNNASADLYGDYGLSMRELGLSQAATSADLARLEPLRQNALALLGLDRELLGLDRERIGLDREGLVVDEGEVRRTADTNVRGINSDFTARGAWFAPEKGARVEDTYASMRDALARIDLQRRGLDIDERGLGIKERGIGLREEGTNLDFAAQRDALNRQAARYGLDAERFRSQLERGLRDLRLDQMISVFDLFGQSNPQAQAVAEQLIRMIMGG